MTPFFAAPPQSEILFKQIRGRRTRLCEGKDSFVVLDFVGNKEYFNEMYEEKTQWASISRRERKRSEQGGRFPRERSACRWRRTSWTMLGKQSSNQHKKDTSWEEFERTLKKRKLAVSKAENSDFLKVVRDG